MAWSFKRRRGLYFIRGERGRKNYVLMGVEGCGLLELGAMEYSRASRKRALPSTEGQYNTRGVLSGRIDGKGYRAARATGVWSRIKPKLPCTAGHNIHGVGRSRYKLTEPNFNQLLL